MALFLGGNTVPQKIESRRRKNNSRQQKIIDYLLKGMLEKLSNDKTTYVGVSMEGATPSHWEFYQLQQLRIIAVSSINMNLSIPTGIHIRSSYLIFFQLNKSKSLCSDEKCGCCEQVAFSESLILSFDCMSLDTNLALYLLLMLLTFLLPEELE